jgi:outer membrane receptor protein involved in Fe transport
MIRISRFLNLLILTAVTISANAAVLKGRVTDRSTKESLIGATVIINELKKGTSSGLDGSFRISDIPAGSYTISCSFIGYINQTREITIKTANEIIPVDFELSGSDFSLNEIVITGKTDKGTDRSARLLEQNASAILNIVSARSIELSPDLTIANVIQRMSGVNLEKGNSGDGQYATLRGMDKRYNYTLVNGVKIPSTNNKYRYMPLDLFPSDLVERLIVSKSLTPDMEGDAIGGAVNMIMKDAPESTQIRWNLGMGYSQLFMTGNFTGFKASVINPVSPYELYGSKYVATEDDFTRENLKIKSSKPLPDINAGFSIGSRFIKNRLGIIFSGSLMSNYRGTKSLYFDVSNTNDERNLPVLSEKQERNYSNHETLTGLHNKVDFDLNRNNTFRIYNAFIIQNNDQVRQTDALLFNSYTPGSGSYTMEYDTRIRHRSQKLYNTTIQGVHTISPQLLADWSASFAIASQQTPDNVTIALVSDVIDFIEQEISVVEKSSTRRWEHNTDYDFSAYANLSYMTDIFRTGVSNSIGGMYRSKYRTSYYNRYRLIPVSERPEPFQNFSQKGIEWNTFDEIHWQILNPPDPTHALNYDATEDIIAFYYKFELSTGPFQWTGGVRMHNINQGFVLHYEQYGSDPIGEKIFTDFLPSLMIVYKPGEKTNLRTSYFRGINLPGFLEIVPYLDKSEEYDEGGNPDLRRCIADNLDLRYEFFPKPLDQLMVGLFYKRIIDPIEFGFVEYAATKSIIYVPKNFGTARNYGAEVDVIKNLRNFAVKANYTYTKSSITTDKILPVRDINGNLVKTLVKQTRSLSGQSEHTTNLALMYKNIRYGIDTQVAASYSSEKIAIVSQTLNNDIWEKSGVKIDFSLEKKISDRLNLFVKANNLLNTPREQYIKLMNPDYEQYPGQDSDKNITLIRRDEDMQAYLIGIRYRFN